MIIRLEEIPLQKNIEVLITYPQKNKIIESIVSYLNSVNSRIQCYIDDIVKLINVSDIYYIESIDNKTVVFCNNENYYVKSRLYQIYEKLSNQGFVRISKYCIININKLEKIRHLPNRCLEAILSNGKHLYVTRKYLYDIMNLLEKEE